LYSCLFIKGEKRKEWLLKGYVIMAKKKTTTTKKSVTKKRQDSDKKAESKEIAESGFKEKDLRWIAVPKHICWLFSWLTIAKELPVPLPKTVEEIVDEFFLQKFLAEMIDPAQVKMAKTVYDRCLLAVNWVKACRGLDNLFLEKREDGHFTIIRISGIMDSMDRDLINK